MLIKNIYTLWGRKRLLHCKLLTEINIPSARVQENVWEGFIRVALKLSDYFA